MKHLDGPYYWEAVELNGAPGLNVIEVHDEDAPEPTRRVERRSPLQGRDAGTRAAEVALPLARSTR